MLHQVLENGRWAQLTFPQQMANIGSETSRIYRALDAYLNAKKRDINLVIRMAEALDLNLYDLLGLDEPGTKDVYGCLYVKGMPVLVNSKQELLKLVKTLDKD